MTLLVSSPRHAPKALAVVPDRPPIRVELDPAVLLTVTVVTEDDAPLPYAFISIVGPDGIELHHAAVAFAWAPGEEGQSRFALAPGLYRLSVHPGEETGLAPVTREVDLPAMGAEVRLVLKRRE